MKYRFTVCLFLFIGLTADAQIINLRGMVKNQAGKPIAGAIVSLAKQGLKDTTGTDGLYSLTKNTPVVLHLLIPQKEGIFFENGVLGFSIPVPSPVKVAIFDARGTLLKRETVQNVPVGFYRFVIGENFGTSKILIIKAACGRYQATFRYVPFQRTGYQTQHSDKKSQSGEWLTVMAAISDTLKATANNYAPRSIVIASYDQSLDITLDTAGKGVKPSPGCGKAATFKGEVQRTENAGSAGSRMYYLRIPDDYDPNHPYALFFTPHCQNGSAENVAHSEPDTRAQYEYLGLWKFANPAGGKGTAIFCAPQGLGNPAGWGSGANDLTFFRYMINRFANELCIDMSRIFSIGFSMGGSMSYALACAMPDTFRAIGMLSGGNMSGCDGSRRGPVPIFITHGTQDARCTWPNYGYPQIRDLAARDGCDPIDIPALVNQNPPVDQMRPVCFEYQNCNPGFPCRACIFKGDHTGSPGTQGSYGKNNTWTDDSAWSYFKRFF